MNDYLEKCFQLHEQGKTVEEIIENIYINYASFIDNDKIYEYKKIISDQFNVSLKDIRLIGSSHTYFSKKDGLLKNKEVTNDYDFAIINTSLFNKYWSIILNDSSQIYNKKIFYKYLSNGKLHPLYLNKNSTLFKDIKSKISLLNSDKSSSICIYAFENAFIKNLCHYLESDFIDYFKEQNTYKLKEINNGVIKSLENIGDKLNGK